MAIVSTCFEIDDDVLQEFDKVAIDNKSDIINNLLKDYIKQAKIEKLNQTIRNIRKNAKPLENGMNSVELIRCLRDANGDI